jgi:hypothetical protein
LQKVSSVVLPAVAETLNPLPKHEMGLLLRHKTIDNKGMPVFHYSLDVIQIFTSFLLVFNLQEFSKTSQHIGLWFRSNY